MVALIRKLHAGGRTILFVEHDMSVVASLARRILVLDRGRLIADGAPDAVRADPAVLSAYLGTSTAVAAPRPTAARPPPILEARGLGVAYGDVWALRDITLRVGAGELVAVVGANGAGKSSLLKTVAGVLRPRSGRLEFQGRDIGGTSPEAMVAAGVALVPEGRELFAALSVEDNLLLGAWSRMPRLARWGGLGAARRRATGLDRVYALFPRLAERRQQAAGSLSGGEAQMVAIGRALMAEPKLLLLDEPSLGLAPMLVEEILGQLRRMADAGLAILLVEQMARAALAVADHGYVLESGRLVAEGAAASLLGESDLAQAYLGAANPTLEGAMP